MNRTFFLRALAVLALVFSREGYAQTITATQTDTFTPNTAGRATPGNKVNYQIQINNTGGAAANAVALTNATPANTTLVPGSLRTTCLAINDAYDCLGNVSITIAAPGVLANDRDPDDVGPALTATAIVAGATAQGGTVTLNANGGFTYNPPAGFNGSDTFTYTLNDNDDVPSTDTATVTINVSGMIWFIDASAGSNGNGRLSSPFNNLASFQAINNGLGNNPKAGQSIFLYESVNDYTGGVVLLNSQRLIGQDASGTLAARADVTAPTGSAALPSMNPTTTTVRVRNAGGIGVALASGNHIRGFTVGSGTGFGVSGTGFGTLLVTELAINNTLGGAISLNGGTFAAGAALTAVTSTAGNNGIALSACEGTVDLGGGTLSGHGGDSVIIQGGGGTATYGGTITKTSGSGNAVSVGNKTGGTVTFSGAITSSVGGINLTSNTGASISLTGGMTINSGVAAAFTATGGGTVTVTGTANTLATTAGTALNVSNTTISATGLTFRSIAANGAVNGIALNNTGTVGGLIVSGTGAVDSGGVIQSTSGSGVAATNTANLSLSSMRFTNCSDAIDGSEAAVRGNGLTGICAITNCIFAGSAEDHVRVTNSSGTLTGLTVTGSTFNANSATTGGHGISVINTGTSVATVTVTGTNFTGIRSSSILMNVTNTAAGTLNVTGGVHTNIGVAVTVQSDASADLGFNVNGITSINAISNAIQFVAGSTSTPSSNIVGIITNNTIGNLSTDSGSRDAYGIALDLRGDQDSILSVTNNTIRHTDINGIFIQQADFGTLAGPGARMDLHLRDNAVSDIDDNSAFPFLFVYGTLVDVRHTTTAYLDVANNSSSSIGGVEQFRFRQRDTSQVFVERLTDGDGTPGELINNIATLESFFAAQNDPGSTVDVTIAIGMIEAANGAARDPLLFGSVEPEETASSPSVTNGGTGVVQSAGTETQPTTMAPAENFGEGDPVLDQGQLDSLVAEAKRRWTEAGLDEEQERLLDEVRFEVAELPGMYLGEASHRLVRIDRDAAGNGWFIDATPDDDVEFVREGNYLSAAADSGLAGGRVDLLTTLMHELGHALGLPDEYAVESRRRIMHGWLHLGERRLPRVGEAASAHPAAERAPEFLSAPVNIGTLPPGKSITVTFEVTVNTSPATFTTVSSQGTVSGSNFANVLTNDPDTVAANDATITPVEQPPTVTDITASGIEDAQLNFAAVQFTGAFSDPNSDTLNRIRVTSLPANGTLRVNTTPVAVNEEIPAANLAGLNFVPAASSSGATSFGYNASDGQAFAVAGASVNITITPVNDPPTLTAIPNPAAIPEDAAEQTVNLSGISEGAPQESSQTLFITASSDNSALIPNPVAVDHTEGQSTGAVRYTPAANTHGTAIITVRVQDSGGIANGGVDTIERTFTVVVNPVADTPGITNASTLPNTQTTSGLVVSRNAVDGAEVTHYQITSIQNGTLFQNNGTTVIAANSFITHAVASAGLKFTPAVNFQGDGSFGVQASTSNAAGGLGGDVVSATITVSERVSIDALNPGDDDAAEGGVNNGLFTFTRGGSVGELVADFQLHASSTATADDVTLAVVGSGAVSFTPSTGAGTVTFPDTVTTVQVSLSAVAEALNAAEAAETVRFDIVPNPGTYLGGTPDNATVTIAQNGLLVTTTNDSGEGSLRQAIFNANTTAGADTITFSDGTGGTVNFADATLDTITLTGGQLDISSDVTIHGPGARMLAVSGDNASRVFRSSGSQVVILRGMTITSGSDVSGAGILNDNGSNLTVIACAVVNNTASGDGGGIMTGDSASLRLVGSLVANNTGGSSGGIWSSGIAAGSLTVMNSTISGNSAVDAGPNVAGGLIVDNGGGSLINSTITNNSALSGSGTAGGVVRLGGEVTAANCLIAGNRNNSTVPDVSTTAAPGGFVSSGHNLIGNPGAVTAFNQTDDQGGSGATPLDPLLGPLANNGGPTGTHALLAGSPAIDAGDPAFNPATFTPALDNDQRGTGFARVTKGLAASPAARVDIGAFELLGVPVITNDDLSINTGGTPLDLAVASGASPTGGTFSGTGVTGGFFDPTGLGLGSYTVTYTVTDGSGNANSTDLTVTVTEVPSLTVTALGDVISRTDGRTSLREALAYAASLTGAQTVDFSDVTTDGAIDFHDGVSRTITLGGTELAVTGSVTLTGPGAERLTVSAAGASRVFFVPADEATISGLTIADGNALFNGGGLLLSAASVTISECVIRDCRAQQSGAGFYKTAGNLVMSDCVVRDNFVDGLGTGAGAFHIEDGPSMILRTKISDNTGGNFGGGVVFGGDTEIMESLLEGNFANYSTGGLGVSAAAAVTVINSTISGNAAAGGDGGGIGNSGTLAVIQSTITDNTSSGAGGGISSLSGTTTISNSLIAGNQGSAAGADLAGVFTDPGGNLIGNSDGATGFTVSTLVGTTASPIDPLLGPLADNGGTTQSHALLVGSPAIDGGDDALAVDAITAPLTTDQRGVGFSRIVKGLAISPVATVDIGAYELFAAPVFAKNQLRVVTGGSPIDLALESGVVPGGGTFSGTGVSGGLFDPGAFAPGDYLVTYTVADAFGVENATTLTVTVTNLSSKLKVERPNRFNPTEVGRKSGTQRVRITNTGGLPLTGLNVRLSGPHRKDFRLVKPRVTTLPPAVATVYQLSFKPRSHGSRKATVTVTGGGEVSTSRVGGVGLKEGPPFPVRDLDQFNNRD